MLEGQIYLAKMRAAQPHLNAQELGNVLVALPPYTEQNGIVGQLRRSLEHIDRLIQQVEGALRRLAEYRAALISAAVTGKIDVRKREG